MDKDKFFKEIKKIFADKKMNNLLAIVIVLAFVLVAVSVFKPTLFNKNNNDNKVAEIPKEEGNTENTISTSASSYEDQQKKDLETMLKSIDGVGEVKVMITFEGGEEKVPAYDNNTQVSTTEETDTQGGKRVNNQQTDGSQVVMSSTGGNTEPFITKTNKPKVIGVMISAKGAENSKVKYDIEKAVSSLFNISADKVHVYTMKK